jgi:release factor glutamine methyltransferase
LPTTETQAITAVLREARKRLAQAGSEAAALEARLLVGHVLGMKATALIAHGDRAIAPGPARQIRTLVERRASGYPMAYLLGRREFWSLPLQVNEHCLIPRPETERLVTCALARIPNGPARVLDLGTGSGAVILALKKERPGIEAWGSDLSPGALALAAVNARSMGLDVQWFRGHWLDAVRPARTFDMVVSNPPYIDPSDPHLRQGDLRFEPRSALVAAKRGLADLQAIIRAAGPCLRPGGWLLLEHGFEQGPLVRDALCREGFIDVTSHRDLAGHERVTEGKSPAKPD